MTLNSIIFIRYAIAASLSLFLPPHEDTFHPTWSYYFSDPISLTQTCQKLDPKFNYAPQEEQLTFLYILLATIVVGNSLVLIKIFFQSKNSKSRMNFFIMHLAFAGNKVMVVFSMFVSDTVSFSRSSCRSDQCSYWHHLENNCWILRRRFCMPIREISSSSCNLLINLRPCLPVHRSFWCHQKSAQFCTKM